MTSAPAGLHFDYCEQFSTPLRYGTINCFLKRTFASSDDGVRFYHLYVGTQRNCVVDLTFSVKPGSTEIQDFALEVLLQSHVTEIRGVQVLSSRRCYETFLEVGCSHSSVDLSAPSILPPWVWVPSTPSMLLSIFIDLGHVEKTNINKKEAGIGSFKKLKKLKKVCSDV